MGSTIKRITVAELRDGAEPSVLLRSQGPGPGGVRRLMEVRAGIPDRALFERMRQEVAPGDAVRLEVETAKAGPFGTLILGFERLTD